MPATTSPSWPRNAGKRRSKSKSFPPTPSDPIPAWFGPEVSQDIAGPARKMKRPWLVGVDACGRGENMVDCHPCQGSRAGRAQPTSLRAERTYSMRPDWSAEEEGEAGKLHAHREPERDLPIINPDDEDDDFDDYDEDADAGGGRGARSGRGQRAADRPDHGGLRQHRPQASRRVGRRLRPDLARLQPRRGRRRFPG